MNTAFVIGTRHYENLKELTCCEADVKAMSFLLRKRNPNAQVVELFNKSGDYIKDAVRRTLSGEQRIIDAFFYFSGHGFSVENDFFFCPTDFDPSSPNRTGVSRNFLLETLRDSSVPQVEFIIDACESGKTLIKREGRPLEERPPLDRFLQFSSSLDDQYSYTGDPLSTFTKAFIDACFSKSSGPIYYTDIEAEIRDAFRGNLTQTPHFIKQGTSREIFADNAEDFRSNKSQFDMILRDFIEPVVADEGVMGVQQERLSRTEILRSLEQRFADRDIAQSFLDDVRLNLLEELREHGEISEFYEVSAEDYPEYIQSDIGPVVDALKKANRRDRLVTVSSTVQHYDAEGKRTTSAFGLLGLSFDGYRETTYSLKLNCDLEGVDCLFEFNPRFKALDQIRLRVVFVPTLERCHVFWLISRHPIRDWGEYGDAIDPPAWSTTRLNYNEYGEAVEDISAATQEFIDDHISFVLREGDRVEEDSS